MLVDIPFQGPLAAGPLAVLGHSTAVVLSVLSARGDESFGPFGPTRLDTGIYQVRHFNFDHLIPGYLKDRYPFDAYKMQPADGRNWDDSTGEFGKALKAAHALQAELEAAGYPPNAYGVCDYPKQIAEKYPVIATDDRQYTIGVTRLLKSEQERDGWRWHKWGNYIGDQKPQCEYLMDEPEIEEVWVFRIYEVEVPNPGEDQ